MVQATAVPASVADRWHADPVQNQQLLSSACCTGLKHGAASHATNLSKAITCMYLQCMLVLPVQTVD
jgi:hypothetical protein